MLRYIDVRFIDGPEEIILQPVDNAGVDVFFVIFETEHELVNTFIFALSDYAFFEAFRGVSGVIFASDGPYFFGIRRQLTEDGESIFQGMNGVVMHADGKRRCFPGDVGSKFCRCYIEAIEADCFGDIKVNELQLDFVDKRVIHITPECFMQRHKGINGNQPSDAIILRGGFQ